MVTLATVEAQLRAVNCNFRVWGRSELRELCHILLPGETIAQAVNGQYEAGFAMLVATDFRVLLIDKKPKYLTLKDIRYDMITELDFSGRMMNSTIRIYTPNKELRFTSTNGRKLRVLFNHTQHKVMEIRHRFMMQQFAAQHDRQNTPPGVAMMQNYYQPLPSSVEETPGIAPQQEPPSYYRQPDLDYPTPAPSEPQYQPLQAPQVHSAGSSSRSQSQRPGRTRLMAAMGNAGLRSIVHNGQIIREYMTVPFQQRWRKRPYGYRHDPVGPQTSASA